MKTNNLLLYCAEFCARPASSDRIGHPLIHSVSFTGKFTFILSVPRQARPDFRDPLMVSLNFSLADGNQGPVLDESLPRSINQTVRLTQLLTTHRYSLDTSGRLQLSF